ncbi:hypothetical protein HJG60_008404 [Phyllostomus discolor]|uniref:Uncharacterized protein n=1 Tax=Phyllostomus discolor TaxID=89673 RepID=A0A833Z4I9_9CHIR|nr:hypothetical protein HJG60_008404 [Phyllostomus discolor]
MVGNGRLGRRHTGLVGGGGGHSSVHRPTVYRENAPLKHLLSKQLLQGKPQGQGYGALTRTHTKSGSPWVLTHPQGLEATRTLLASVAQLAGASSCKPEGHGSALGQGMYLGPSQTAYRRPPVHVSLST